MKQGDIRNYFGGQGSSSANEPKRARFEDDEGGSDGVLSREEAFQRPEPLPKKYEDQYFPNDIANAVGVILDAEKRKYFLTEYFVPDENFNFAFELALKVAAILIELSIMSANLIIKGKEIKYLGFSKKNLDLVQMHNSIKVVTSILGDWILGDMFEEVLSDARKLASELEVQESLKPSEMRQFGGSVEEYMRQKIFIPYVSKIKEELEVRFTEDNLFIFRTQNLLPSKIVVEPLKDADRQTFMEVKFFDWCFFDWCFIFCSVIEEIPTFCEKSRCGIVKI